MRKRSSKNIPGILNVLALILLKARHRRKLRVTKKDMSTSSPFFRLLTLRVIAILCGNVARNGSWVGQGGTGNMFWVGLFPKVLKTVGLKTGRDLC